MAVKRALEGLPGVQRADVSFRDKEARVTFDPARVTTNELIQAIDKLGFRASLKGGGQNALVRPDTSYERNSQLEASVDRD